MPKIDPTGFRKWLRKKPKSGASHHAAIYAGACFLLEEKPEEEVYEILRRAADRVTARQVPDREIRSAIACAKNGDGRVGPRWPDPDYNFIRGLVTGRRYAFMEQFPGLDAAAWLREAFPHPEGLLCVGRSASDFTTARRTEVEALFDAGQGYQFITPSYMTAREGITKEGKYSAHTLANTGPRIYLVVEFDSTTLQEQAASIGFLAGHYNPGGLDYAPPLEYVAHSGGKSLHAWFKVAGIPEAGYTRFFRTACLLGADPKTWTRSQFVRLPGGIRDNGMAQTLLYSRTYEEKQS